MNHLRIIRDVLHAAEDRRSGSYKRSRPQFLSQGASQDRTRSSQQNSLEGSGPKYSGHHSARPPLSGGSRDTMDFLGAFTEVKKEKSDSQVFAEECRHIQETLHKIQQFVSDTKENNSISKGVLEKISDLSLAVQSGLNSLWRHITGHLDALCDKVKTVEEIDVRIQQSQDAIIDLGQKVESLKSAMESLKKDQVQQREKLEEVLEQLNTLVSEWLAKPAKAVMVDKAVQRSPGTDDRLKVPHGEIENIPHSPHVCVAKRRSRNTIRKSKKRPLVLQGDEPPDVALSKPPQSSQKDLNVKGNAGGSPGSRGAEGSGRFFTYIGCWSSDSDSDSRGQGVSRDVAAYGTCLTQTRRGFRC
ncbi:uncharacterized protein LOC128747122 isoform X1 [Synchiropus splendidus]|uniref:uncharacterized protein LOC128747122 isoform X1 n=1 Tax=Synchiropus splendidus TaxID=270530 RepID=UPI00237DE27F|nr:uncharacterized protein LOC128747122 isoform X1 [Synchiropus splendidus]